jgi:prepilin-type N-terminal cleavage/methylation domain-containing protein
VVYSLENKNKNKNKNKNHYCQRHLIDSQKGFTLIELLIVTTILSLLMFIGAYSYSLFTNKWQSELGQFNHSNQQIMGFSRLKTLLTNIIPYVIIKDNKQPAFFFIGAKDSLLSITHDGLFSNDGAEAFRLSVVKTKTGKFNLLYQAKTLADMAILTESQNINFDHQLLLAEQFDEISFSYFGWYSFFEKQKVSAEYNPKLPRWSEKFSGLDKQLIPEKITVNLKQDGKTMTLLISLDQKVERLLAPYFDNNDES